MAKVGHRVDSFGQQETLSKGLFSSRQLLEQLKMQIYYLIQLLSRLTSLVIWMEFEVI